MQARESMGTQFIPEQDKVGRNHAVYKSMNEKPYSNVRRSVGLPLSPKPIESINAKKGSSIEADSNTAMMRKQVTKIPSIIKQIDQRQGELHNRLATARNTTIQVPPNMAYGALTGALISNRHVRTN